MKRRVVWIVGGAVVVVLAAIALVWVLTPRGSAEDQALAYLRALADGDIAAVEATGVDITETAASAFASASDHVSAVAVESSTTDDDSAVVVVSYQLAGAPHESTLTLSQRDGRWVPNAAAALGSVHFAVPTVIDETMLTAEENTPLLPAVYEVRAAPAEFLDGSTTIEVLPGTTRDVDVDTTLRPSATEAAQAQLDDYLAECTRPAAEAPPSCGIVIPWGADFAAVSGIRYRIEQAPALTLTPSAFHADGGALVATVTGTALDGSAKTLTYRTANWGIRGDVSFTADDIVLSVW